LRAGQELPFIAPVLVLSMVHAKPQRQHDAFLANHCQHGKLHFPIERYGGFAAPRRREA
jgi:hypothetical protein